MEVTFADRKLARDCSSVRSAAAAFGAVRGRKIRSRLDQMAAAHNLEVLRHAPGRCHELRGDRAGQLSLDLDGPYRLIFEPVPSPPAVREDGGLDWSSVQAVHVVAIVDTHR